MNSIKLNKIYVEDNLKTMSRLEDKSIDYILTSPPYNISAAKSGVGVKNKTDKYKDFKDNVTQDSYFDSQKNLIEEMLRITKNHIFYNIQMLSGNKVALHKLIGYFASYIKEVIIWSKRGQPAISECVFNSEFD